MLVCPRRPAFTLIELLVVVTIIVVLLALLVPALDKAIYQADLASCAATLDGVATGAIQYAMSFNRQYPRRDALRQAQPQVAYYPRPNLIRYKTVDDLFRLKGFIEHKMLLDPLSGRDLISIGDSDPDTTVYTNYYLWWDWGYAVAGGGAWSSRLGQQFSWMNEKHNLLASDEDYVLLTSAGRYHSSHPDIVEGTASHQAVEDYTTPLDAGNKTTVSRWNGARGALDNNYAFQDGAVLRVPSTSYQEPRLARVPLEPYFYNPDIFIQVAR